MGGNKKCFKFQVVILSAALLCLKVQLMRRHTFDPSLLPTLQLERCAFYPVSTIIT